MFDLSTSDAFDSDPWADDGHLQAVQDSEWNKLSDNFTNAGYREGITAGKEGALQEGFDAGFSLVGVPLGRELGLLRGLASALLSHLDSQPRATSPPAESSLSLERQIEEARAIVTALAPVRLADIAPRDVEAEQHAKEHLAADADDDAMDDNEELAEKRRTEQLEDMMRSLDGAGSGRPAEQRIGVEGVRELKVRLEVLCAAIGLNVGPNWS
ncbi:hypothetical protein FA95DRAFT_1575764 [Auriscalpium vulgare]|uniref:Uncharacterized protein n=1 Tax=Auriscalpium vulgare TaxID=40419 RepID=A0ACB8RE74_9AGAM|nr:hypothetical protein FA95DRAFT_1575764 [Auriscalpium vulgare]